MLLHLEKAEQFNELKAKGLVLVDFFATWCGPCRMLAPELEKLATLEPDLTILKIDVDEFPEIASDYDVSSIPALFLLKDGKPVANKLGFANVKQLQAFVHQAGELTF